MSRYLFLIYLCLGCGLAHTEVYKWTDSNGKVHYGDRPSAQVKASRIEITPSNTSESVPVSNVPQTSDGYSTTLHSCLDSGGSMDECVRRASNMQMEKLRAEREQAERAQSQARQSQNYASPPVNNHSSDDFNTARRAAEQARERKEKLDGRVEIGTNFRLLLTGYLLKSKKRVDRKNKYKFLLIRKLLIQLHTLPVSTRALFDVPEQASPM